MSRYILRMLLRGFLLETANFPLEIVAAYGIFPVLNKGLYDPHSLFFNQT